MSDAALVGLIGFAGAGLTALVTWLVGRRSTATEERKTSGTIQTSEAAVLWDQAEQIRKELRDEVEKWRAAHQSCEDRYDGLRAELDEVREQLRKAGGG